ncbi:MAG: aromatic amino acid lyase, partial [Dehalococcoidia bacterium]
MTAKRSQQIARSPASGPSQPNGEIIYIGGRNLTIKDVIEVARNGRRVRLDSSALKNMETSRRMVEDIVADNRTVYGVNTGFGDLSTKRIPPEDIYQLQQNLVRSHAVGVGPPFPDEVVRAIMLLQANKLSLGYSAVSPDLPQILIDCLAA